MTTESAQSVLQQLKEKEDRKRHGLEQVVGSTEVSQEMAQWAPRIDPNPQQDTDDFTIKGEVGQAVWGATVDAVNETYIFFNDAARYILPLDTLYHAARTGSMAEGKALADAQAEHFNDETRRLADIVAPDNKTLAGSLGRGILQFLIPYGGWLKVARAAGAGRVPAALRAGAVTDASVFNPDDPNLSNLVQTTDEELFNPDAEGFQKLLQKLPDLSNPVNEFLATNPNDADAANRLRNSLEGLGLGYIMEGFIQVVRRMRGARATKATKDARIEVEAEDSAPLREIEVKPKEKVDGPDPRTDESTRRSKDTGSEPRAADSDGVGDSTRPQEAPRALRETVRDALRLNPAKRKALQEALLNDDYSQALDLIDFNSNTIDWDSMDDGDNIRQLINTFSEMLAENIDEVGGGVQSLKQTQRVARMVGASADETHRMFTEVTGDGGLAARMLAAEELMLASAKRVQELTAIAKESLSPHDAMNMRRAIEMHAAIQSEIKGAKKEVARALHAMRTMKKAQAEIKDIGDIEEILRITGSGTPDEISALIKAIETAKNLDDLNVIVRSSAGKRLSDAVSTLIVNGLLSMPKTQVLNLASNMSQVFLLSADRYIAGTFKYATGGDSAMLREANIDAAYKFSALSDAWLLAKKAFKEGVPVTDPLQRIEVSTRQGFNAQAFGASERGWIGGTLNWMGRKIEIPGRFLLAGDEFFKTITVRGETAALAYRKAVNAADEAKLTGDARGAFVKKHFADEVANPSVDTQAAALHQARYATFQERPQTKIGSGIERGLNANAFVKLVIAPFFRTPMNILRQGLVDRTPLGIISRDLREAILRGSPEQRAIALARMTTGTAAIALGYQLVGMGGPDKNFEITGRRAFGSSEREDGSPDYGVRIFDTWYQYNRFDPIGTWLGMAADIHEYMKHQYDPDDPMSGSWGEEFARAWFSAAVKNSISKAWFTSVEDIERLVAAIQEGNPERVKESLNKFAANQTFKLVPFSSLVRGSANTIDRITTGEDAELKEVWGFWSSMQKNIPLWNRDLPPKRDYLGRIVRREDSELFLFNPFTVSPASNDPLERLLSELSFNITKLPKSLEGGKVPLSEEQYSEYKWLIGQEPWFGGKNLEQTLQGFIDDGTIDSLPTDALRIEFVKGWWSGAKKLAERRLYEEDEDLRTRKAEVLEFEFTKRTGQEIDINF